MKILKKKSTVPWWNRLKQTCVSCDAVFVLEAGDAVSEQNTTRDVRIDFVCPECGRNDSAYKTNPYNTFEPAELAPEPSPQ